MNLLRRLFNREKPKTFEGTVVGVEIVDGFTDRFNQHNRYWKQNVKAITGYDESGMPIIDEYTVGQYKAIVVNPQGQIKTFERHGRVPEIGSQQSYKEAA